MRAAGFKISRDTCIWAGASFRSKRVVIGSGVFINVGFYHDGYDMLEIGDNVRISPQGKPENYDGDNYNIRDGIVVVPKGGVIRSGTIV